VIRGYEPLIEGMLAYAQQGLAHAMGSLVQPLHKIIGKDVPSVFPTHEALGHVREGATMGEIPWWVALIIAWAAGSTGFLLGLVLAVGARAERDLEELDAIDRKKGWKQAHVLFGYDVDRWPLLDTRWTNMASAKRARAAPR
jgi:hypothetical protein